MSSSLSLPPLDLLMFSLALEQSLYRVHLKPTSLPLLAPRHATLLVHTFQGMQLTRDIKQDELIASNDPVTMSGDYEGMSCEELEPSGKVIGGHRMGFP
jgi:hypothetical protein